MSKCPLQISNLLHVSKKIVRMQCNDYVIKTIPNQVSPFFPQAERTCPRRPPIMATAPNPVITRRRKAPCPVSRRSFASCAGTGPLDTTTMRSRARDAKVSRTGSLALGLFLIWGTMCLVWTSVLFVLFREDQQGHIKTSNILVLFLFCYPSEY